MRVGLIGAGFIGRTHAELAKSVPGMELVGFVDPAPKANVPELAGVKRFDTVDALLKARIDGAIVATPDAHHVSTAKQCLAGGAAVLLEKPAAQSLAEGLDLASAPNVATRLIVGHHRRHHAASRMTKKLIADGKLGKLIGASGTFALRKDDKYFVDRPRGVGLVNLIHDLDLLQFFCGRVASVSAEVSHAARGAKEEDTIAMTVTFDGGVIGSFVATDSSPSPWGWDQATKELPSIPFTEHGTTYALLGTKGSLSVPNLVHYAHGAGEAWHHPLQQTAIASDGPNAYLAQLHHFMDVMAGKAKPICGIADALATQAALEAVFISAREGRRILTTELVAAARTAGTGRA